MRIAALLIACAGVIPAASKPFLTSELLFPPETWHNHASSVVELPNGDLFACWYHGSGERTADDVIVEGARLKKGAKQWTRFKLADTPGFPDTNPTLFFDSKQRLWLWWQTITANQWESAVTNYRIASNWRGDGAPKWDDGSVLWIKPRNFETKIAQYASKITSPKERAHVIEKSKDKQYSRLGWMNRAHPIELKNGRILVPLYSDGYSISLMAYSDDAGATWTASEPLVGDGNIQATLGQRKDGTIAAWMRDNGPPPKRLHYAESADNGETWSEVRDSDIPNSGTGVEVIVLRDGRWVMINNDTDKGRYSLRVSLSDDEGRTWKWQRRLEYDPEMKDRFHYPSILQSRDGSLHATYSVFLEHLGPKSERKSIKHAHFNVEWIMEGDPAQK